MIFFIEKTEVLKIISKDFKTVEFNICDKVLKVLIKDEKLFIYCGTGLTIMNNNFRSIVISPADNAVPNLALNREEVDKLLTKIELNENIDLSVYKSEYGIVGMNNE